MEENGPEVGKMKRWPPSIGCMIGLALAVVFAQFMYGEVHHVLMSAQSNSFNGRCMSNLKLLANSIIMYSAYYDDHLPPAYSWRTSLSKSRYSSEYIRTSQCLATQSKFTYAFNARLDGITMAKVEMPASTVMIFESDAVSFDAVGSGKSLPQAPRHNGADLYAFVDGHAKQVRRGMLKAKW
ncbi:MAG: hypothetical protein ABJA67_02960 [Chthonomonadales bacterium]